MIYFISDLHFCHDRPFIYEPRGFNSINEMNEVILKNWNSTVDKDDDVYILGDLILNDIEAGLTLLRQLNGKLHLIRGNHDQNTKCAIYECIMEEVTYATMIKYKKYSFFLTHYPSKVGWIGDDSKLWNLAGHTHSKDKFENGEFKVYNVACDAHNCTPVCIDEILEDIRAYKTEFNNEEMRRNNNEKN